MTIHQFRKQIKKVCPVCLRDFVGLKTAKFCSGACRVHSHRTEKKAAAGQSSD